MPLMDCPQVEAKWRAHCRPTFNSSRFFEWRIHVKCFFVTKRIGGLRPWDGFRFCECLLNFTLLGNCKQIIGHFMPFLHLKTLAFAAPTSPWGRYGELSHRRRWRVGSQYFSAVTDHGDPVGAVMLFRVDRTPGQEMTRELGNILMKGTPGKVQEYELRHIKY